MDLIIDIGNSTAKIALYDTDKVVERFCYDDLRVSHLEAIFEKSNDIERGILSTTRLHDERLESFLREKLRRFVIFDPASTPTPLQNRYRTPETLGADRLAASVAAWSQFKGQNIVVFDLGTAITVDFVSAKGEYLGGNISPGLAMRLDALHRLTDRLPLCAVEDFVDSQNYGVDTQSAILQGVVRGICYEIESYIEQNEGAKIFFTGGDALYFEKRIKNTIFADHDAVLKGLSIVLDF